MIPLKEVHEETTVSYQFFVAIEFLNHLYHTSHLLIFYSKMQKSHIFVACGAAGAFILWFLARTSHCMRFFASLRRKSIILSQKSVDTTNL